MYDRRKETPVFQLRFHELAEELKKEFIEMIELFNSFEVKLIVKEEKDGVYTIRPGSSLSAWAIVAHKYMYYANDILENSSGLEYSPVCVSYNQCESDQVRTSSIL